MAKIIEDVMKNFDYMRRKPGVVGVMPLIAGLSDAPGGALGENVGKPVAEMLGALPADATTQPTPQPSGPKIDTRTPFQKWLGNMSDSMEASRLAEQKRVQMATGGDGQLGTSPMSRVFGFFTDTPEEAQKRAARVAQGDQTDWKAIADQKLSELAAARENQFVPAPASAPQQAAQTRVARVVGNPDIAGAFVNKYGSQAATYRPTISQTTNGGLEDFMKATKGMNLDQITSLIGLKPAPTKPRGYKDVVADALSEMAAQDYAAVIGDETATNEQKLQARSDYMLALQKIMGLDPMAEILSQLGQQSE